MDLEPPWEPEGGADATLALLAEYDTSLRRWTFPETGALWEAVEHAHALDRRGAGRRIAVIDSGFDLSYAALAHQRLPWGHAGDPTTHGTAVALLVNQIAPAAELHLYPVAEAGAWKPALIEAALRAAGASAVDIVNLSFGKRHPLSEVYRVQEWASTIEVPPGMRDGDEATFLLNQAAAQLSGWRDLMKAPHSPIGQLAAAAARAGRIVIAAAGNMAAHIFEPAVLPEVFSAGFDRPIVDAGGIEFSTGQDAPVGFSQSDFVDFTFVQPDNAYGSSFAAPLLAGFAALMLDPTDLNGYREAMRVAVLAGKAQERLPEREALTLSPEEKIVLDLYDKALRSRPHGHLGAAGPCPECYLFATPVLLNAARFTVSIGDLPSTESFVEEVERFAPWDPMAWAIHGLAHLERAELARRAGSVAEVGQWLTSVRQGLDNAFAAAPELCASTPFAPYREVLARAAAFADDPANWQPAPGQFI